MLHRIGNGNCTVPMEGTRMKRLLVCLLFLVGIVLAGCKMAADEDVHLSTDTQQIEVTVDH